MSIQKGKLIDLATKAAAKVTGRRFCSHHQGEVAANEGRVVERNRSRRWVCFRCIEKSEERLEAIANARRPAACLVMLK
jgi:hypothetical protein